jgi:hypothetical protein
MHGKIPLHTREFTRPEATGGADCGIIAALFDKVNV